MIGASTFQFLAKQPDIKISILSINAINHAIKKHSDSDIQIALKGKTPVDLFSQLPLDYHSYINVFSVSESDKLLLHRTYDHAISLEPKIKPDHGHLYLMLLLLKTAILFFLSKKLLTGLAKLVSFENLILLQVSKKYEYKKNQKMKNSLRNLLWAI